MIIREYLWGNFRLKLLPTYENRPARAKSDRLLVVKVVPGNRECHAVGLGIIAVT